MLFDAELAKEIERQVNEKKSGATLAEKLGVDGPEVGVHRAKRFTIAGDDGKQTLMWRALMKDCAFYFDAPTIDDEVSMKKKLQRKYDPILKPGWIPPLQSRRDLVTWACNQYNDNLKEAEDFKDENLVNCENYKSLMFEFGPDYDRLRGKLGFVKGLFD